MDARATATETQHSYSTPNSWSKAASAATASVATTATATTKASSASLNNANLHAADGSQDVATAATSPFPSHLEFLPFLFPQQSNIYQAQLLHYNRLISPSRGGGLQSSALPPIVSASHVQASSRSRSSSKASLKDGNSGKANTTGGHGGRSHHNSDKGRPVVTSKEAPPRIAGKSDQPKNPLLRSVTSPSSQLQSPAPPMTQSQLQAQSQGAHHSSSVPTTPQQHARQFSFESREPSPTGPNSHSPRSAYSETNSTLPSLRPLPPRLGGCKFETAQMNSRRRIPYTIGNDRLEQLDLKTVKSKLSEDEEKKLGNDMQAVFDRLIPTPEVEEKRKKLVDKLEKIFNDEWPGHEIKVNLFGSSGNLLCSDDSDVDICITTPWRELEGVCIIANLLAKRGMEKVVCISAAKVPIVKIWDPELSLACDMNVNNTLALENTRMVRTYVETDPRVRQLAMIIKYWTRRRIVNDAAFGGTLSSYTWICLIIAFLQLRNPPVLPALHQLPYKIHKADGTTGEFADNLKKLKGFGSKNKSSEADLLFQFFRFYAHEFDYDKQVLSVRLGKLVTKTEKTWHYSINNSLCVEEPFNTTRNLGNTADEYSFRGLHLELRRAFDLISAAKFEEACEQYVFPKEEERVWSRPAPQPRPVLLRSSSQSQPHSGRGGRGNHRGGGRHNNNNNNNNNHRGGNSNRRASSSVPTYDGNVFIPTMGLPQDVPWYQTSPFQFQYAQQDLMNQMAYHQENMRHFHLYAQSPAFLQHQAVGQQTRVSSTPASGQQSTDRSRTNSFDNPPLSAPLRPELYALYGMTLAPHFYAQAATGYGTYPSSPAATTASNNQEFRRPLQRASVPTDVGASASNSSIRSQSQPASRTPQAQTPAGLYPLGSQPAPSAPVFVPRHHNSVPIPSFMPDDVDFDETPKAVSNSPRSDDGLQPAYFTEGSANSAGQTAATQLQASPATLGEVSGQTSASGRRRLSTDQIPQTILDRRMRRTSRSPSPLGHARAFSVGTGAATASPASAAQGKSSSRPLVVNGSGLKTSVTASPRQPSGNTSSALEEQAMPTHAYNSDNPLYINTGMPTHQTSTIDVLATPMTHDVSQLTHQAAADHPLVVANGTTAPGPATGLVSTPIQAEEASFRDRIALMNGYYAGAQGFQQDVTNGTASRLSPPARQRQMSRQPQSGVIAPLDLAISENRIDRPLGPELSHLSPVYETRTPSPTVARKFEGLTRPANLGSWTEDKATAGDPVKPVIEPETPVRASQEVTKPQKSQKQSPQSNVPKPPAGRENGHVRGAKSESDGGWQKAGKGKKKTANGTTQQAQAEQPPKHMSDRKGG
ncbi:hypothetical protein S40285_06390 [Stachybotrys chlorohalonatus IBT 40285]|uniref:polynucleotide adenylyltransferase n=1 Tax=Stachybotrys chlorohalonatus (strain IBT 40285) TaxID=1283841 RepID=A0A084QGF8_STAC4|nr:hypothetical protein S40285_06390 [Stachybotrys chlorohalonata IBT 40285]